MKRVLMTKINNLPNQNYKLNIEKYQAIAVKVRKSNLD